MRTIQMILLAAATCVALPAAAQATGRGTGNVTAGTGSAGSGGRTTTTTVGPARGVGAPSSAAPVPPTGLTSAGTVETITLPQANANVRPPNLGGLSQGQTSSGTAAGPSSGGVTGRDASLTRNSDQGFTLNPNAPAGTNGNGTGGTDGTGTPGETPAAATGAVVLDNGLGDALATDASAPAGGSTASAPANGGFAFSARSATPMLDRAIAGQRQRSSREQSMWSTAPRTNNDRGWQMPDDYTPLMPGTR